LTIPQLDAINKYKQKTTQRENKMSNKLNGKAKAKARKLRNRNNKTKNPNMNCMFTMSPAQKSNATNRSKMKDATGINKDKFIELVEKMSEVLIENDNSISYQDTDERIMFSTAHAVINKHPQLLEQKNMLALNEISLDMTHAINKQFNTTIGSGPMAWMQDPAQQFAEAGVPQVTQVMIGLIDMIGGILQLKSGRVQVVNA
jgi:hypothetical protein